ncbi:MAG TPA: PilZ domain-containing protein [Planctomycetota bacterium]|nr:PilZ domain-containing protein [Planctomycetota bacterium]
MGSERRIHKRYIVPGLRAKLREKIFFGLSSKPTPHEYPCLDISASGLQFATKKRFTPQSNILIDISIPTSRTKPIRAKAKIVWFRMSEDLNSALAGLQFVAVDKKQMAELKMLMEKVGSDKDRTSPYIRSKILKSDTLFVKLHK